MPPKGVAAAFCTFSEAGLKRSISYRLYGPSDADVRVLFTMGLAGDNAQWDVQVDYFLALNQRPVGKRFQICTYDNRGTGLSDAPPGRWRTSAMAGDAMQLLDHLGWRAPRSVHLVGFSMGGMITQELAMIQPSRFASICFMSTWSCGYTVPPLQGMISMIGIIMPWNLRSQLRSGLSLLYPPAFLDELGTDPVTGEQKTNLRIFKKRLIERGARMRAEGMVMRPWALIKQGFAAITHRVTAKSLAPYAPQQGCDCAHAALERSAGGTRRQVPTAESRWCRTRRL